MEAAFWIAVSIITYAYIGYPVLLVIVGIILQSLRDLGYAAGKRERRYRYNEHYPNVQVIIAAHDEEKHIEGRIQNLLAQDYPPDKIEVLIGSDGSHDRTVAIAKSTDDGRVKVYDFESRRGKASVINDLVSLADAPILVMTDANTVFRRDAIRKLVSQFEHDRVGVVCGELTLVRQGTSQNEDVRYWRLEQLLKFYESRIGGLLGANGGIYAIRRGLYQPIPANTIIDDFVVAMRVAERGYKLVYNPEAVAYEETAPEIRDEFNRRVRIGMGNYQALMQFWRFLSPAYGARCFSFISHKVLRWFVPHAAITVFVSSYVLSGVSGYRYAFYLQFIAYSIAILGYVLQQRYILPAAVSLQVFTAAMNVAIFVGFLKFIKGGVNGAWTRTSR